MVGGRLRAAILSARPRLDPHRAVLIVAAVAKVMALGLLVVAWLVSDGVFSDDRAALPESAISCRPGLPSSCCRFLSSSAHGKRRAWRPTRGDDAFLGYDFSEGYTSLERSGPKTFTKPRTGPLLRWWQRRRATPRAEAARNRSVRGWSC